MLLKTKTLSSTKSYWDSIHYVRDLLAKADRILVGIGSGITASGGINYEDKELTKKWFPSYYSVGLETILDIQSVFWNLSEKNILSYWGYWARHIQYIRYDSHASKPYLDLFKILKDKDYFICSTNVYGQLEKSGFKKDKVYAPQGDYALFQCSRPCTKEIYNNKQMIERMLNNLNSSLEIKKEDIPYCPRCGSFLIPNLRKDYSFVEEPHLSNQKDYIRFIDESDNINLVLLELGVGHNTPVIIRYPFEQITKSYDKANLIRINLTHTTVPEIISDKSIVIPEDIGKVLCDILKGQDS